MQLTQSQKKQLVTHAHQLNPVVIIGANGLTDAVLAEIDTALNAHELVKIRVNATDREERSQMIEQISQDAGAQLIHRIGHVATFFRKNPQKRDTKQRLLTPAKN